MPALKKVSRDKFLNIERKLSIYLMFHNRVGTFRLRSPPDEDWWVKDIVELFERNSTIKGSVDNVTIYVMPIYYFDQRIHRAGFLVASLFVEKDVSGYTVKIFYQDPSEFHASNQRSVEKYAEKNYNGFIRLLRRAVSSKHPNAVKLAELVYCSEKTRLINLLYSIYGDEILNDDTIPCLLYTSPSPRD